MRALLARAFGPVSDLEVCDVPPPELRAKAVRIRVRAAGVAFATKLVIEGKHQNKPALPLIPGSEFAGEVVEVAEGVTTLKPGDRIVGSQGTGGYAEEIVVRATNVRRIPDGLGFAEATQFATLYPTAYGALRWRANLKPGETLLVHGAAGGTGITAIEVGKAMGATVIATISSAAKAEAVRTHGADHAIDYTRADMRERVLELTGGRGADVIFDPVGGDLFDASMRCVAPEGRILTIGYAAGRIPQIGVNLLLVKNASVMGFFWGWYIGNSKLPPPADAAERLDAMYAELFRWFEEGRLKPRTHARFGLADVAKAFDELESRRVIGKVVLTP
ncbi:NADPH:quinone oxidoreductase family protein [Desertibaculum subflavum]|uniref:NADPH:quinone oxidoreductase family protein n=1 Tax=Desertibaculum subflavum TaxID=2268458 RepID=UPI000E672652